MCLILQQKKPEDYVIVTGETNSLKMFLLETFNQLGLNWKEHVKQTNELMRPTDLLVSSANVSKAKSQLGWQAK